MDRCAGWHICLVLTFCSIAVASGQIQNPPLGQGRLQTDIRGIYADPPPLPASLAAAWQKAELIVVARTVGIQPKEIGELQAGVSYRLQISQVIKEDLRLQNATEIQLTQLGGVREVNGRKIETKAGHIPHPQVGEQAVLFLTYWPHGQGYATMPVGYFEVRKTDVIIPGGVRHFPEFAGRSSMPLPEFVAIARVLMGK